MRLINSAGRVPGPKPGTGSWICCSGLPNFSSERPGRGKAQRAGGEPPAAVVAAHQDQVFLDQQRGCDQRGVGETRRQGRSVRGARSPRCPHRCGDGCSETFPADMRRAIRALPAGRRACRPPRRKPVGDFGIEPALLGEIGQKIAVDLDPVCRVERLQPDGEQLRRAIIGRVWVAGENSCFFETSNPAASASTCRSVPMACYRR